MQLRYLKNIQEVQDGAAKECRLFFAQVILINK